MKKEKIFDKTNDDFPEGKKSKEKSKKKRAAQTEEYENQKTTKKEKMEVIAEEMPSENKTKKKKENEDTIPEITDQRKKVKTKKKQIKDRNQCADLALEEISEKISVKKEKILNKTSDSYDFPEEKKSKKSKEKSNKKHISQTEEGENQTIKKKKIKVTSEEMSVENNIKLQEATIEVGNTNQRKRIRTKKKRRQVKEKHRELVQSIKLGNEGADRAVKEISEKISALENREMLTSMGEKKLKYLKKTLSQIERAEEEFRLMNGNKEEKY